jgi:hypothetical protein
MLPDFLHDPRISPGVIILAGGEIGVWRQGIRKINLALLPLALALLLSGAGNAWSAFFCPDIRPGYGVTSQAWLSKYFSPLKGTHVDTPVYFLDSGKPGATVLVLGGTHGREIAGFTAATVLIEAAEVLKGRLIVIPYANRSAVSIQDKLKRIPRFHPIVGRSGQRYLPYGDRRTDPVDQGRPDPEKFVHPSGLILKDGAESRNLNRVYPGKADGTPTEQLAYAILELIRREKADFNLDLHESETPEYHLNDQGKNVRGGNLAYMLLCHPRGMEIGSRAILNLEMETGIVGKLRKSNPDFRGLSHLEIGNATASVSFLFETPNPAMDRWREKPDPIRDPVYPLEHRVGAALRILKYLADGDGVDTGREISIKGLPEYPAIMEKGVGAFLN